MPNTQATTTPPRNKNAPVTCRNSSQSSLPTPTARGDIRSDRRSGPSDGEIGDVDDPERHLGLLTETIEAVSSTVGLEEVLSLVASKVADALQADACFVYLYDER